MSELLPVACSVVVVALILGLPAAIVLSEHWKRLQRLERVCERHGILPEDRPAAEMQIGTSGLRTFSGWTRERDA